MKQHERYLLFAVIVTTGSCFAYLVYAAIRGMVGVDILTLVVALINTGLLVFLFRLLDRQERDA